MVNGEKSLADILIEIVKEFNKNKINYVIIGGFAMVFHGMPRFTEDIDIAIDIDEKNLKNSIDCFVSTAPRNDTSLRHCEQSEAISLFLLLSP